MACGAILTRLLRRMAFTPRSGAWRRSRGVSFPIYPDRWADLSTCTALLLRSLLPFDSVSTMCGALPLAHVYDCALRVALVVPLLRALSMEAM